MATLADAFAGAATREGIDLAFRLTDGPALDDVADLWVSAGCPEDQRRSRILGMGAYVGEVLVRSAGGRWDLSPTGDPGVALTSTFMCFPLNKVGKRLSLGPEHSIAAFLEVAAQGPLPREELRRMT